MSYETARLLTNPLFMDALSGEFTPSSDTSKTHTLGRLLVATFQKGEITERGTWKPVGGDLAYDLAYQPSWAPTTDSRITCLEKDNWAQVTGIWLHDTASKDEKKLGIMDFYFFRNSPGNIRIVSSTQGDETRTLTLGQSLDEAREAVTTAAQSFFS